MRWLEKSVIEWVIEPLSLVSEITLVFICIKVPASSHSEYDTGPVITFRDLVVQVPTKDGSRSAPETEAKAVATIRIILQRLGDICADWKLNASWNGVCMEMATCFLTIGLV